ncbi:hypothetical protein ABH968_002706 [Lysinibacillus sp. RC79]
MHISISNGGIVDVSGGVCFASGDTSILSGAIHYITGDTSIFSGAIHYITGDKKKAVISFMKEITAFPMWHAFLFSQLPTD